MDYLPENERRKIILRFYEKHVQFGKIFTVKHYQNEGNPKNTIYDIVKRADLEKKFNRKTGSGRSNKALSDSAQSALVRHHTNKEGISDRKLSRNYNVSTSTIRRIFVKSNVKCYKCAKGLYYTKMQLEKVKNRCKKLQKNYHG